MKVVIRTDASVEIGTGHVMRCLTLAKQLRNEGVTVVFLCRNFPGNSITFIEQEGFKVVSILSEVEENNVKWVMNNWRKDAGDTQSIIKNLHEQIDVLLVDHYGIDARWETEMRPFANKIIVIDDLANRNHDCDLLLDQNYYLNMESRYANLLPISCVQLLGPDYVLLRDEFMEIDVTKIDCSGQINNVLIFYGGSDPTGETVKALEAIRDIEIPVINVVVGAANPRRNQVEQLCNELINVTYHCQINNMAELMMEADFAIGAGGATTWERCYLKLPSLVTVVAQNQLELTNDAAGTGCLINLGAYDGVTVDHMKEVLTRVVKHPEEVKGLITKCSAILNAEKVGKYPVLNKIMEMA